MWVDNTGRLRQFGQEKAVPGHAGEYVTDGSLRQVEFHVNLAQLPANPLTLVEGVAQGVYDKRVMLPRGAQIEKVEIITSVAPTSTSGDAELVVGVIDSDWASNGDADAIVTTDPGASAGVQVEVKAGGTGAGVLLGPVNTKARYFLLSYGTEAFTGGEVDVRIHYNMNHQSPYNGPGEHS